MFKIHFKLLIVLSICAVAKSKDLNQIKSFVKVGI